MFTAIRVSEFADTPYRDSRMPRIGRYNGAGIIVIFDTDGFVSAAIGDDTAFIILFHHEMPRAIDLQLRGRIILGKDPDKESAAYK